MTIALPIAVCLWAVVLIIFLLRQPTMALRTVTVPPPINYIILTYISQTLINIWNYKLLNN